MRHQYAQQDRRETRTNKTATDTALTMIIFFRETPLSGRGAGVMLLVEEGVGVEEEVAVAVITDDAEERGVTEYGGV